MFLRSCSFLLTFSDTVWLINLCETEVFPDIPTPGGLEIWASWCLRPGCLGAATQAPPERAPHGGKLISLQWSALGIHSLWFLGSFGLTLLLPWTLFLETVSHCGSSLYSKQSSCPSFPLHPVSFCLLLCNSCMAVTLYQRHKGPACHTGTSSTVVKARPPRHCFYTSNLCVSVLKAPI